MYPAVLLLTPLRPSFPGSRKARKTLLQLSYPSNGRRIWSVSRPSMHWKETIDMSVVKEGRPTEKFAWHLPPPWKVEAESLALNVVVDSDLKACRRNLSTLRLSKLIWMRLAYPCPMLWKMILYPRAQDIHQIISRLISLALTRSNIPVLSHIKARC